MTSTTVDMFSVRGRTIAEQEYLARMLYREGEAEHGPTPPLTSVTFRFNAGILIRNGLENNIRQFLDLESVRYELRKYPGWVFTDFHLVYHFDRWEDVAVYATLLGAMRAQMTGGGFGNARDPVVSAEEDSCLHP